MRIISCNIANFGKLHDLKLSFTEGLNRIEERNGWGKSTLSAFVKAMLYGLEGDGKRDETVCERKHYKPWQGGTFGGSLVFEAGGKRYEVFRSFGSKSADDVFELRDYDTKLVSSDYTEKLGEELFKINADSFARTVFIKQSEAGYSDATADINAKLGNISDHLDLNRFDTIEAKIKDELNALSATRKTGEIYKLKDSVTELKARILADSDASSGADSIRARIDESKKKIASLTEEKAKLTELRKQASLNLKRKTDRETIDNLIKDLKAKEVSLNEAKESLNYHGTGEVSDSINLIMERSASLSKLRKTMAGFELCSEEREELSSYRNRIKDPEAALKQVEEATAAVYSVASFDREAGEKDKQAGDLDFERTELIKKKKSAKAVFFLALGSVLLVAAVLFLKDYLKENVDSGKLFVMLGAGAGLILLDLIVCLLRVNAGNRDIAMLDSRIAKLDSEIKELDDKIGKSNLLAESVLTGNGMLYNPETVSADLKILYRDCHDYNVLLEKEKRLIDNDRTEECEALVSEIKSYFFDFGLSVNEDEFNAALSGLMRKSEAYMSSKGLYSDALARKEEFEQNHDVEELLKDQEDDIPALEEIDARERALDSEIKIVNDNLSIDKRQLEAFMERIENVDELEDRLDAVKEAIADKSERVSLLEGARDYLLKAKENLAMRYIGPLWESFSSYYRHITGNDALDYTMDANLNLSVSDGSLLHSTGFLSDGYRDLTGVCMRLALADAMYPGEKPMLILDDPFVNLDKVNHEGGMKLLDAVSGRYQVLYFTCR
ncbi:MAG: AAA family ATPase [Lachnospiraceae bacterium]|nr:AAA family ATPase [Lachnospiraceae bacterium]